MTDTSHQWKSELQRRTLLHDEMLLSRLKEAKELASDFDVQQGALALLQSAKEKPNTRRGGPPRSLPDWAKQKRFENQNERSKSKQETRDVYLFLNDLVHVTAQEEPFPAYAHAGSALSLAPPLMQAVFEPASGSFSCTEVGNYSLVIYNRDDAWDVGNAIDSMLEEAQATKATDTEAALLPICPFPMTNTTAYDSKVCSDVEWRRPSPQLDVTFRDGVLSDASHRSLCAEIHKIADITRDRFMPQYQNIVDPNLLTTPPAADLGSQWMASDVKVAADGRVDIDYLHDLSRDRFPSLYDVSKELLEAAMPALAQMKTPAFLLPGTLQTVFKAQRIIVRPSDSYDGMWHREQKEEHIAAVIVYYTEVTENVVGGQLEFCARRAHVVQSAEDGTLGRNAAKQVLVDNTCKVPVKTGRLLVFSNYESVHRVLRMKSNNDQLATREFVMFHIVDQRQPLVPLRLYHGITEATHEAISVAISGGHFPRVVTAVILQYAGLQNSPQDRVVTRKRLMRENLTPSGVFGGSSERAFSTGNGCPCLVGWLDGSTEPDPDVEEYLDEDSALLVFSRANKPIEELDRGVSAIDVDGLKRREDRDDEEEDD